MENVDSMCVYTRVYLHVKIKRVLLKFGWDDLTHLYKNLTRSLKRIPF